MTTLIVYASTHGCARQCVERLAARLDGRVMSVDLKKDSNPDPGNYDAVIVGGSIHAGRVQGKVRRYLAARADLLKAKKLGLFLCCMEEGEKADQQFRAAFPADLIAHAAATGLFGGAFDFDKMNFLQKVVIKKVSGVTQSVSKIRLDAVDAFADKFRGN